MASNIDLWSRTNANTHKEIDVNRYSYINGRIDTPEDFNFTLHSHTEILVKPRRIKAVWIRESSSFAMGLEKRIKAYARTLKASIMYINENDMVTHIEETAIEHDEFAEYDRYVTHAAMWR